MVIFENGITLYTSVSVRSSRKNTDVVFLLSISKFTLKKYCEDYVVQYEDSNKKQNMDIDCTG